jgi:ribosomal-protein-alanine N-acetyltransferase
MTSLLPRQIATARLRLREPAMSDAGEIFRAYTQDVAVCRFMVWTPHACEAVTRQFIDWCTEAWKAGERLPYVITRSDSDAPIGMIEARLLGTTVDIGYVLARSHWGQGLMPEAIRVLAGAALADPGIFRVHAACDVDNIPSQRALEKSGFTREGRLDRLTVHPNISPEPRPCFMYAKCR